MKVWFSFIIFLLTLQSYYFYQVNLAIFPLVALFMLICIVFCLKLRLYIPILPVFLYLFFLGSSFLGVLNSAGNFYIFNLFGVIAGFLCCILVYNLPICESDIARSIRTVLTIHISVWYLQFFFYYLGGTYIDFLKPITGEAQRAFGWGTVKLFGQSIVRPTGLFNEPSTYGYYSTSLFFLWRIYSPKKILEKQDLFLISAFSLSLILSFSLINIFYSLVTICYLIVNRTVRIKAVISFALLLMFILPILKYYLIVRREYQLLGLDVSGKLRFVEGFNNFLDFDSFLKYLFGEGMGNLSEHSGYGSLLDFVITKLGLLGFFLISFIFLFANESKIRLGRVLLFFILLVSAINITYLYFHGLLSLIFKKRYKIYTQSLYCIGEK